MSTDASAFAALGLEPDADDREIERAYKRLIKEHHPDREGGDAARAAEINRAYRELRGGRDLKHPIELHDSWTSGRRQGRVWLAMAVMLAATMALVLLARGRPDGPRDAASRQQPGVKRAAVKSDPMDQPLDFAAIDDAAGDAFRLSRKSDEMELARASRDCHHGLRNRPTLAGLDRCAAFDAAVIQLQDRDPLRDQGPFSEIAVTGRIRSAASALSSDSVAIDGRLDRIRLRVEMKLTQAASPGMERR